MSDDRYLVIGTWRRYLNVACPACGQPVGAQCVTRHGNPGLPHVSRIRASTARREALARRLATLPVTPNP